MSQVGTSVKEAVVRFMNVVATSKVYKGVEDVQLCKVHDFLYRFE